MQFSFELTGHGWARATVAGAHSTVELTASYLGDALGDLLRAVADVLDGASEAHFTWDEEPGEFRWSLLRRGGDIEVLVTTFAFDEVWDDDQTAFADVVAAEELALLVSSAARDTLSQWGERGYLGRWGHPFPSESLARIGAQISMTGSTENP